MSSRKLLLCFAVCVLGCSGGGSSGGGGEGGGGGGGSEAIFPLDISDDGRHLEGDNGESFLINGDAAWALMVALDATETEQYLEDRRQRGFNTIVVKLINRNPNGPANANGDAPFLTPNDFTTPNEAYFAHADFVIDRAAAKDMLVLLAPAYLGFDCGPQDWCQQVQAQPVSAMESYGRFLGGRYRDRDNILWVHGGDTRASDHGVSSRVSAIANAIMERAPAHLHTAQCSRGRSAIECYDEPWLDVNTTYSNCDDSLGDVRADFGRNPRQVFFYIEGTYENEGASLGCLIDQAAWPVLGGGVGHVFGNNPMWFFGSGWEGQLGSAGSQAMAHLGDLFASRAWFRLRPDLEEDVLVSGGSAKTAAAITSDRETLMVYTDQARSVVVDVTALTGTEVQAWFFDPSDGSSIDLGQDTVVGTETYDLPRRGVLVVDDAAAALPRPGTAPD